MAVPAEEYSGLACSCPVVPVPMAWGYPMPSGCWTMQVICRTVEPCRLNAGPVYAVPVLAVAERRSMAGTLEAPAVSVAWYSRRRSLHRTETEVEMVSVPFYLPVRL